MVGPYVSHGAGKVQSKLIAFLDDASRVVCHGEFFLADTTETLLHVEGRPPIIEIAARRPI